MTKKNKTYHLTIKTPQSSHLLDFTLTLPNQRGYCYKCELDKEIWVISERYYPYEGRKFCRNCALSNLEELEDSNFEFENKKVVIKEIRESLLEIPVPAEEK